MNSKRGSFLFLSLGSVIVSLSCGLGACSSDSDLAGGDSGAEDGQSNADGAVGVDGGSPDGTIGATNDAAIDTGTPMKDATVNDGSQSSEASTDDSGTDAGTIVGDTDAGDDSGVITVQDAGQDAGPPGYLYIGRFDTNDAKGARMAWPGTAVAANFDGTSASVTLTQVDGFGGGPSWFNVIVDGVLGTPFSVTGTSQPYSLATGLAAGGHSIQIVKRTEANLGTVRFEGMTFAGGAGLQAPPSHPARRIEFLADSTIDGFGVEGDRNVTCINDAPPQYDNAMKSMSFFTASGLNAEMVLTAYSGKGIQVDEDPMDTDTFPIIFPRTLPESAGSTWDFSQNTPDAVVVSLGGTDLDSLNTAPAGFQTAYNNFIGTVRGKYPNAYLWMTVWSQIKNDVTTTRTAMTNVLNSILATRMAGGDNKIYVYVFPEANVDVDETGCYYHANATHNQNMANLMITEIKNRTGW